MRLRVSSGGLPGVFLSRRSCTPVRPVRTGDMLSLDCRTACQQSATCAPAITRAYAYIPLEGGHSTYRCPQLAPDTLLRGFESCVMIPAYHEAPSAGLQHLRCLTNRAKSSGIISLDHPGFQARYACAMPGGPSRPTCCAGVYAEHFSDGSCECGSRAPMHGAGGQHLLPVCRFDRDKVMQRLGAKGGAGAAALPVWRLNGERA